jgi:hypothetical protein
VRESIEELRTTISCAIFSSGLKVLKTESTQSFLDKELVFWAYAGKIRKRQRRTPINFCIRL